MTRTNKVTASCSALFYVSQPESESSTLHTIRYCFIEWFNFRQHNIGCEENKFFNWLESISRAKENTRHKVFFLQTQYKQRSNGGVYTCTFYVSNLTPIMSKIPISLMQPVWNFITANTTPRQEIIKIVRYKLIGNQSGSIGVGNNHYGCLLYIRSAAVQLHCAQNLCIKWIDKRGLKWTI